MSPTAHVEVSPDTIEQYRRELTGYCYRMLGSGFEADDAVQETMLRAWRAADGFEGRSSVRSWLYRIATNICLDMLPGGTGGRCRSTSGRPRRRSRRCSAAGTRTTSGYSPIADDKVVPEHGDPAEIAVARDTIRLAFVTALQAPARQAAGHADHVRSAADARGGGGDDPGYQRGRREQRAAAGPGHARRAARGTAADLGGIRIRASCWPSTSTRSSGTTWNSWSRCYMTTR